MTAASNARLNSSIRQFSLRDLFEYVSLWAVLAAFAPTIGVVPTGLLVGFSLALAARQGFFALMMLMGASAATDLAVAANNSEGTFEREFIVLALAVALVGWCVFRRGVYRQHPRGTSG